MKASFKHIVLGAGHGGLAMAALLASQGEEVLILESHSTPGGQGGYFKKDNCLFDAGATTLSGMAYNGPLKRFQKLLNLDLPLKKIDPGLVIVQKDQTSLNRYADPFLWKNELNQHFPKLSQGDLWNDFSEINQRAWEYLEKNPDLPPKLSPSDILAFLKNGPLKGISLLPYLTRPLRHYIPAPMLKDPQFVELLNQMLLISTQSQLDKVPALVGILGLCYLQDTHYLMGGMCELTKIMERKIKSLGGEILYRKRVTKILEKDQHFIIEDQTGGVFTAENLYSDIPFWNLEQIYSGGLSSYFTKLSKRFPSAWGALSGYMKVKLDRPVDSLYYQIHHSGKSESTFLSFSHPEDKSRAPAGFQALTLSTHAHRRDFPFPRGSEAYVQSKLEWEKLAMENFRKTFKNFGIVEADWVAGGTPLTFERYTKRFEGRVGGIPHELLYGFYPNLLAFPGNTTPHPNFYLIGDTTFPGQGIVGVITGAMNLFHRMLKKGKI